MRKSFTRFLGLFTLFCVLGFQVVAGVKTLVPADGNANAAKTTDLAITFDYPLSQGSAYDGAVIQLMTSGGSLVDQINVPSSRFTFSADMKTITMDIQANLTEGASYYVVFPANVVKENNVDGTTPSFAGYSASTDWNFTVGDYSAPILHASTPFAPAKGSTNVGSAFVAGTPNALKASSFTLNFDESVKGGVGYIKIYNANGEVHEMIDASALNATASSSVTFSTSNLRENSSYYILVDAGAFIDASTNKNKFGGITSNTAWTFSTRDYTAPVFATDYPAKASVASTSFSVVSKLDEKGTVKILVYTKAATEVVGFTAPSAWVDFGVTSQTVAIAAANTEYTIPVTIDQSSATIANATDYVVYYIASNEAKYFNNVSDPLRSAVNSIAISTTDNQAPTAILAPLNNATGVEPVLDASTVAKTLSLTFNEKVKAGSGSIIIYNGVDNTVFESIDITSSKVSFATATPWIVKIKPAAKLASLKTYYIKIASGVITDASGNKYAGLTTDFAWRFTSKDYEAATATWSTPAANSLLNSTETVTATFNETIHLHGALTDAIVVEKDNVVILNSNFVLAQTGTTISVTPTGAYVWTENSTYVVKVLANTIYDGSENILTKELKKGYQVNSYLNPTATFNPATGATVGSTKTFKVIFSEPVALNGGNVITDSNVASLITLVENGGSIVPFTATWDASKLTALVTPVSSLTSGKSYTMSLSAGYQDNNKPTAKNPVSVLSASFTVSDSEIPTVAFDFTKTNVSTSTTGNAIKIKFSEPVFASNGTTAYTANAANLIPFITLREGSATGKVINVANCTWNVGADGKYTINPAVALTEGATYYLAFSDASVYDATPSLNPNVGNSTTFVTEMAPALVSTTPADKATDVNSATTNSVSLTFGEPVKPNAAGPATAMTVERWDATTSAWVAFSTTPLASITFVGNNATFPIGAALTAQTKYRVSIAAGAVLDADNTASKAISNATSDKFVFTTKDNVAPAVVSVAVPGAVASSADSELTKDITITFNEEMMKGSGAITITDGATFTQTIDVNSTLVTLSTDKKTVKIAHNPFVASLYSSAINYYSVMMPAGTFKDLAGNNAIAFTNGDGTPAAAATNHTDNDLGDGTLTAVAGVWYFATDDNNAPAFDIDSSSPVSLSDKNALGTDLIIKFNENIFINDANKKVIVSYYSTTTSSWLPAQSYKISESNVTVSGNTIAVALVDLAADTQYEITLEGGAVKDNLNTVDATGIASGVWYFYTGDFNGPKATFTVNGTIDNTATPEMQKVDRTSDIVITFDEAIRMQAPAAGEVTSLNMVDATTSAGVVSTNAIKLVITSAPTVGIAMEANIDAAKKVITIPASTIAAYGAASGTIFTITVANLEDVAGNNIVQQTYSFQIDDYTAPTTTTATLSENKLGTQVVLDLLYNENANAYYLLAADGTTTPTAASLKANGTMIAVDASTSGTTTKVTIPTIPGTEYELFVVATDRVRNTLQANGSVVALSVRSADITDPAIVTYGNNGKTDVDATVAFAPKFTFGTDVTIATGNIYIYKASNNALAATFTQAICAPGANAKEVVITIPANALPANTAYYMNIDKGLFTDVAGTVPNSDPNSKAVNQYPGLFDATTYTFSTADNVAPAIADLTPYGADTDANITVTPTVVKGTVTGNIAVTFDSNIVTKTIGSGDILIREGVGGSIKEVVLLTNSATTSINGKVLTINPVMDLVASKTYEIELKAGILTDASTLPNANVKWNFVVEDVASPTVLSYKTVTSNKLVTLEPVGLMESIDINFSENVYLLDKSIVVKADVDTLVSFVDAAGVKVPFSSTVVLNKWTLDPTAAAGLKPATTYTISFGAILSDLDGNTTPAQSVTFTTKRSVSPTIVYAPVSKSTDVAKDFTLTVTSDQSLVQAETTGTTAEGFFSVLENSELKNYVKLGTGTTAGTTDNDVAFVATISTDKKVITIDPVVNLLSGTKYYFQFNPLGNDNIYQGDYSDLVDSLNNAVIVDATIATSDATKNRSEFTVVDYQAPVVAVVAGVAQYIPNEAGYLGSSDKLSVKFNEKVKAGTGDVKIYRKDGTLVETIAASTLATKSDDETVILINPSVAARENNMEYYIMIPSGAIVDKSTLANPFAGTVDYTTWTYSTTDNMSPLFTQLSPTPLSTDVYIHDNLVITFDKKVVAGSGNIAIYKKGGDAFDLIRVSATEYRVKIDPSGLFATIDFARTLDENTEYYVEVEPGTFLNAKNTASKFAGIMTNSTWTFSTEVTEAPKVIVNGLVPADNATAIPVSNLVLGMTFDRAVMKGSGVVKLIETATGTLAETVDIATAVVAATNATITFLNPLKSNTDYHVIVEAGTVTNTLPSKVAYAGITSPSIWNFTTVTDVTAPKLLTWTPNATTLTTEQNHPTLVMTFDEALVLGAGSVKIVKKSDNVTALTIPITAAMVSDKTVTVTYSVVAPATGLDQNTDYYVLVDAGIVKDAAGNATAAVTDVAAWTFKTGVGFVTEIVDPKNNSLEFKVYPNPFVDYVTVSNASELTKVVVSNIAGQVVKEVVNPENTIQLNELRSGVYFISLYQENAVIKTAKIVKR